VADLNGADLGGGNLGGLDAGASYAAGGWLGPLARAQYKALARLRWRMFTNGLRSSKGALELGARTFGIIIYILMGLGVGAGMGTVTYFLASSGKWSYLPILFWVLAFFWQIIPVMLASFQEQFDLGILLRFPLRFGSYVLLYLVFGLMDISTILGGLCCLGIWIGMAAAQPGLLLWTTLALAVFAGFNILLVRAVFAWIDRWLAQRKTREILGAVFMVGLLSVQVLNPALYQKRHSGRSGHQAQAEQIRAVEARYSPWLKKANAAQKWLPPGLAALSLREAVEQEPAKGFGALGVLGLYALLAGGVLAVRLKAEYRGESLSSAPARDKASSGRSKSAAGLSFPGAGAADRAGGRAAGGMVSGSGPITAVMEKDVRSLMRTLPLLYAIGAPLLLVLVFSGVFIKNGGVQTPVFPLALPVCTVYAQLGFTQVFYNNLGTEGAGIQLYFLSPTPFRTVMLAKNLLHALLFAMVALLAGVLTTLRLGAADTAVIAATVCWLMFSLPCNLTAGNIFSLKMPYRVNPGRISRQRGSQANAMLSLLVQLAILAVGAAVFLLSWFLNDMWMAPPIFILLAVGALLAWKRVLNSADAIAFGRRDAMMAALMKES
jgi:ABC-2 type transport system permease protein